MDVSTPPAAAETGPMSYFQSVICHGYHEISSFALHRLDCYNSLPGCVAHEPHKKATKGSPIH